MPVEPYAVDLHVSAPPDKAASTLSLGATLLLPLTPPRT